MYLENDASPHRTKGVACFVTCSWSEIENIENMCDLY